MQIGTIAYDLWWFHCYTAAAATMAAKYQVDVKWPRLIRCASCLWSRADLKAAQSSLSAQYSIDRDLLIAFYSFPNINLIINESCLWLRFIRLPHFPTSTRIFGRFCFVVLISMSISMNGLVLSDYHVCCYFNAIKCNAIDYLFHFTSSLTNST